MDDQPKVLGHQGRSPLSGGSDVRESRLMTFLATHARQRLLTYASNGAFELRVYWPVTNEEPMFEFRATRDNPLSMFRPRDLHWARREIDLLLADIGKDE